MANGLEKRLSRLEKQAAERTEEPKVCNCRITTRFHNAACLEALLKGIPRVCPVHGFRELGRFSFTPSWYVLLRDSDRPNDICPCPPHPWRWFVLNGPRTWEAQAAAREAWTTMEEVPTLSFEEEHRRLAVVVGQYFASRQLWYEKLGRQPPSQQEIVKLGKWGMPKFVGR